MHWETGLTRHACVVCQGSALNWYGPIGMEKAVLKSPNAVVQDDTSLQPFETEQCAFACELLWLTDKEWLQSEEVIALSSQ